MANIGKNIYGGENSYEEVEWRKRNDPGYFQAFQNLYQGGDPSRPMPPTTPPPGQNLPSQQPVPPPSQGMPRPTFPPSQGMPRPTPGAQGQASAPEAVERIKRYAAMGMQAPPGGGTMRSQVEPSSMRLGGGIVPPQSMAFQTAAAQGGGKKGGNRAPPKSEWGPEQWAQQMFGEGAVGAGQLADHFFKEGTLDRLGTDPSREMRGAVDDYQRVANRYAQGGRSDAQQGMIDRMSGIANQYQDGGRSGAMQGALGRYEQNLEGYSGQEGQAMREQAERGLNSSFNTSARAIQAGARRNRLSGAAQTAQLGDLAAQRMQAQSGIETDLAVRGADEKRRALDAYSGRLGSQEAAEYERQLGSAQAAGQYLTSQEDRDYSRMREAQDARLQALRAMEGDTRSAQEFNAAQQAAEVAGRYGTYFGSLDVENQRREQDRANRLNRRALRAYERSLGGNRSSNNQRQDNKKRR